MEEKKYDISVLVVEDEAIISMIYKGILKTIVYNFKIVANAENALEEFNNYKYDLIISDIVLPGMSGLEFIQKIREFDKNIQVVFASAMDNTETLTQAISLGVSQYLIKPINKEYLIEIIEHCYSNINIRRELIKAQLALENANENLNIKVKERTEELEQINKQLFFEIEERKLVEKDLIKAKDAAENANKAKDSFLANVSHELRTPLNGINGILYLLEKSPLNEKQHEYIKYLKYSSELLLSIINDLLDFAKVVSGKIQLDKREFILKEVFDEIIPIFKMLAEQKKLNLEHVFDEKIPKYLNGDKLRIKQILNNVLSNSIKFTEKGVIKIKTEFIKNIGDEIEVLVSIKDTGIGIPQNVQDKIFTPFVQADGSFTRKYGGTGLGLSISKGFVELHNGEIWFESVAEKGTTFFIKIPFEYEKSIVDEPAKELPCIKNNIKSFFLSKEVKVLIIEDNQINCKIIEEFLVGNNCQVSTAENGSLGLDRYAESTPDIIITDIQMPVMNGLEFAQQSIMYEKEAGLTHVPIIAITAHTREEDKKEILSYGIDDFISKPIDFINLLEIIYNYVVKGNNQISASAKDDGIANITSLSKAVFNKKESIIKYIDAVIELFPKEIEEMRSKLQSGNLTELKNIAHSAKSSISNFSAKKLFDRLEYFRSINSSTDSTLISLQINEIEEKFLEFKNKLEQIKKELENEGISS